MKISVADLKKVEPSAVARKSALQPNETVSAIFKVRDPGYVPPNVRVRARIDATMFTGELSAVSLEQIETDPHVVSVSLSKPLRILK